MDDKQTEELQDDYRMFVPIEDHDLMKSVSVDENGDYIVQGVMSSDAQDEEDDSISPEGMDCTYFLEKGWVKYEHGNKPEQFIGEPLEVKVGRFDHPTLLKSVNGVYVKARLFAVRGMTKSAIEAMEDLQKSNTKRRMGWSIEGSVQKRDKAGKIVKSVIRNVVLTMNPVNTSTWAELSKSFSMEHELTVDVDVPEEVEKAMDIESTSAINKQSLEGVTKKKKKKDGQQSWIDLFRSIVKKTLTEKSFQKDFFEGVDEAANMAYYEAVAEGHGYDEADEFATYVVSNHALLKSLATKFGGGNMSKNAENTLSALLDSDLDELKKSLDADNEEDVNEEDYEDEEEESEEDKKKRLAKEKLEKSQDEEGDEEGSEEGDDEEEDEDVEKSMNTDLTKSMSASGHKEAFEVSGFLADLTDEIGYSLAGFEKSMGNMTKTQKSIVGAVVSMGDMMKSLAVENSELRAEVGDLHKSFGDVMNRPVGRKGVVSQRETQTLSKSMSPNAPLSKAQIGDILMKSFEAGDIPGSTISRFEAGTPLDTMNLPDDIKQQVGL